MARKLYLVSVKWKILLICLMYLALVYCYQWVCHWFDWQYSCREIRFVVCRAWAVECFFFRTSLCKSWSFLSLLFSSPSSLCRLPACKQALQLLKIIHDTQWTGCLKIPYSLNTVFHMQKKKKVNFSHVLCLTASPTNNNHINWNQEIKEATSCELFIGYSCNTGPMILDAPPPTLSLSLSAPEYYVEELPGCTGFS